MKHEMFIVRNEAKYHGPFRDFETSGFAAKLRGDVEVIPLWLPYIPDETPGPTKVDVLEAEDYRTHVDSFKADTRLMLAGITQDFYFARRERRVLTANELEVVWKDLYEVSRTVESLMHYVEVVIADPKPKYLEALRKAFWRNRNSDDFDAHYDDRSW